MMNLQAKFRAFKLDTPGSLCSVYKDGTYTLIEARLPIGGIDILIQDIKFHNKEQLDVLHITSWDVDHCDQIELRQILDKLRPARIEIPGYVPDSDEGKACRNLLLKYDDIHQQYVHNTVEITPAYIAGLPGETRWSDRNVLFPTDPNAEKHNDRSLIKLFRSASFTVLSLGDCESEEIGQRLMRSEIFREEVDVLILPHHGANNGFITDSFLKTIKPQVAVATSNRGNEYDHPRPEIRALLAANDIPLMTSKDGDAYVYHEVGQQHSQYLDTGADSQVKKMGEFVPKRIKNRNIGLAGLAS
jgi:competence protein ComEC